MKSKGLKAYFTQRASLMALSMSLKIAEIEAAKLTISHARNRGYSWESLRECFEGYPHVKPVLDQADSFAEVTISTTSL